VSSGVTRFRLLGNDEHDFLFACLKDWPVDKTGKFTMQRALATVDAAMREHMEIKPAPLSHEDDYFITFVIEETSGGNWPPIGITKAHIKNGKVFVSWLAFLPEMRGSGRFKESYLLWSHITFVTLEADELMFVTPVGNTPVESLFEKYTSTEGEVWVKGLDTDRPKRKWVHTRADHIADRDTAFTDKDGKEIIYEDEGIERKPTPA